MTIPATRACRLEKYLLMEPEHSFYKKAIVGAAPARVARLAWQVWSHPLPNAIFQHQSNRHPSVPKKAKIFRCAGILNVNAP